MQCGVEGEGMHLTAEEGAAYSFSSFINQHIDTVLSCQHTFDLVTWGSFHDDGLRTSLYDVHVYQGTVADNMH